MGQCLKQIIMQKGLMQKSVVVGSCIKKMIVSGVDGTSLEL